MIWRCRHRTFDLTRRVLVMGIVNVTPDSFSDGGRFQEPEAAIAHGRALLSEGADLLDLGGESTRPGSAPVPADEQLRRLMPVIEPLVEGGACVSIDTSNAAVAEAALAAGAEIVNDVTALSDPAMTGVVAAAGAGLVLMHMQGNPRTMQKDPRYEDAAREVREFLQTRLRGAMAAGVLEERIAVDPGIGFGKKVEHSLELIARIDEVATLGRPVVLGASRKSFIGRLIEADVHERLEGGLAAAAIAVFLGARVIRTHDVAETVKAAKIAEIVARARRV